MTSDPPSTPPVAPPGGRVDVHRECLGCGYDLWNQPVEGVCSECGRDVRLTLATPVWAWQEPECAARFAAGLRTMAWSVLAVGGVGLLTAVAAALTGGRSDVVPMVGGGTAMCVLGCYVAGLLRATLGAPAAPVLGFLSAGLMSVYILMVVWVILEAAGFVPPRAMSEERYVQVIIGTALGQGIVLGLWQCLNSHVVSSRRRSEWMMWCGLIGSIIAGTLGLLVMALMAGLERSVRPGSPAFVLLLLVLWGTVLSGMAWSVWVSFLWLRIARRVDDLRMGRPRGRA